MKTSRSNVEHHIETTGPPVFAKARPLSPQKCKIAKEEFQQMMDQGICRPSSSPWASPLHMVEKKNGQYRPCGDYRRLNAMTVPDRYPVPRLHDFTHCLENKNFFSKLDLEKAYFQIKVRDSDIPKTAIITPFGLFEFTKMCFGLRNAGQTFQRHIDNVLRGLPVFPFIDDILIASETEDQHREHLQEVFRRLEENGLTLNVSKCIFGVPQLDFLGYTVSNDGIRPTEEKVKAISTYPLPETIQQLRRFLGMLNFYRENIPQAAEHQKELHKYLHNTKKNDTTKIQWTDAAKKAFVICKEDIKTAALLHHPSSVVPYSLMTDASDSCAGAVLQQKRKGSWVPIGFYSKKFTEAQRKYSTYDRELLSIYMAIRHFRHIFEGQELTIYTDHKPLTYALTAQSKNETPRRARYLDYIGQFASEIKYISGKDNEVADALSRIETISCPSPINYEQLAESQKHDVELGNLQHRSNLKFQVVVLPDTSATIVCEMSTGVARPFLTPEFRKVAYKAIHELSHPGIRGTRKLITSRFFWPSMNKDVSEWTRTCIPCQRSKVQRHVQSPLEEFEFAAKLRHVHIDIIGPLPISNGYRYCLTMIDRGTKWTEACPIMDITAETVATAFYESWISRFGTPEKLTTDQGRTFQSDIFKNLSRRMGIQQNRTTAYHPQTNGIIERWHRTLKSALTTRLNANNWSYELPTVLLGLRAAIKEDIGYSAAELLYGQTIRLPGEFCGATDNSTEPNPKPMDNIIKAIRKSQEQRKPNCRPIFVPQDLYKCDYVFVRHDAVSKPLTPAYDGPFPVIERNAKFFKICINKKFINISIDRLKPAYVVKSSDQEATQETRNYAYVTRYGRVSKQPKRFAEGGVV